MSESISSNPSSVEGAPHQDSSSPNRCWISFGGNVGDVKSTFNAALALLSLHSEIQLGRRSGLYSTAPMGRLAGSPFVNAVCELVTTIGPDKLLKVLQCVENHLGRVRDVCWGPRTIDLDLMSYGTCVLEQPDLVIPHPGTTYRRFVLDPLVEVDRDWIHPKCGFTAGQLLERLNQRPLSVSIVGIPYEHAEVVKENLLKKFPDLRLVCDTSPASCPGRLRIRTSGSPDNCNLPTVDLRRSPGDLFERLSSALTAIFDQPSRVSDW